LSFLSSIDNQSIKYKRITLHLAKIFGATNVPINAEFRELIQELDPRYNLPHRKKVGLEIDELYKKP